MMSLLLKKLIDYFKLKGKAMKALLKFIFKLVFKLVLIAAALIGSVIALNKFAPDVFDSLTDWLKENRND